MRNRIRAGVYAAAAALTGTVLLTTDHVYGNFHETHWFGILGLIFLYFTMIVSPLYRTLPGLPGKPFAVRAQQALGISAFWFSLLHGYFGFFPYIGGFDGLQYWTHYEAHSLFFGFLSLVILGILTLTSIPFLIRRMGAWWKRTQRLLYAAGVLALVHVLTVTINAGHVPWFMAIIFLSAGLLIVLELFRFDAWISGRRPNIPRNIIGILGSLLSLVILFWACFILGHHIH